MSDDVSDIRAFYDSTVAKEDTRLERHPIEHDVTWRYLEKHLPPSGKVLDIGAGTGAYTVPLARRGYLVTAVDFSPALVKACETRVRDAGLGERVTCLVADARDLSGVTDDDFDAVLLMGPLYHLRIEEDRQMAIRQGWTRMKPGAPIFSSFISRYGIWGDLIKKNPRFVEDREDVKSTLEKGRDTEMTEWGSSFRAYFATASETVPLHERQGFRTLAVAGVEPLGVGADEAYRSLPDAQRRLWLDLMFTISTEKSIIGASNHLLYVGEKVAPGAI